MDYLIMGAMILGLSWVFERIVWKCTSNPWLGLLWWLPIVNIIVLVYAAGCAPVSVHETTHDRLPEGEGVNIAARY
jgi:hypothetical protein